MPFDANLVLVDGSAVWSFANVNTSDYGTPISTTRNAGGFVILDLGSANIGSDVRGIAIVLILPDNPGAAGDELPLLLRSRVHLPLLAIFTSLVSLTSLQLPKGLSLVVKLLPLLSEE